MPHVRTYFYAGGEYAEDGKGGHLFHNQMYVEKLVPAPGVTQKWPIVLMHGNCMTGTVRPSPLHRSSLCTTHPRLTQSP